MRRLPLLLVLALLSAPALADGLDPSLHGRDALTDASPKHRQTMLSVFLEFPAWYYGWGGVPFGVGARFGLPLLHNGLVAELNDSLGLEFGGDLFGIGANPAVFGLDIPAEVMWTLHFFPKFAAYLKLGIALELRFGSWYWPGCTGNNCGGGAVYISGTAAVGGIVKLTESMNFRIELGYPGLKVGLGFAL